jgi:hypothetical protein
VLLHTFSSFNDALLNECAQPILKGLTDCCKGPNALRSELAGSPDFWAILSRLSSVPEAAGDVFAVVEDLTTSIQPGITADNYEAAIALLNEFATAAQVGAREEQLFDQASKRSRVGQKPKKPDSNEVVVRGSTAMSIVFQLSDRVPNFIDQSHLETKEGMFYRYRRIGIATNRESSMDSLLVTHPQDSDPPMSQPLPRNPPTSFFFIATHFAFRPPRLARPQGMGRHIQRSLVPAHYTTPQARGLPVRSFGHERNPRPRCYIVIKGVSALPSPTRRYGRQRTSRPLAENRNHYGPLDQQRPRRQSRKSPSLLPSHTL